MVSFIEIIYIAFISLGLGILLGVLPRCCIYRLAKKNIQKINSHNKDLGILYNIPYIDRSHTISMVFMEPMIDTPIKDNSTIAFQLKHGKWSKIVRCDYVKMEKFAESIKNGEYIILSV